MLDSSSGPKRIDVNFKVKVRQGLKCNMERNLHVAVEDANADLFKKKTRLTLAHKNIVVTL
jgi:hypothetical protein